MEVRLLDRVVDLDSGRVQGPDGASAHLPPQPCRLLALLIDRAGEVVPRQEIRDHLWPDVTVDYDSGLHFTVRQIRSALGDDAAEPRFIETLPRRGYRLLPTPEPVAVPVAVPVAEATPSPDLAVPRPGRARRRWGWRAAALGLLALGLVLVLGGNALEDAPPPDPPRLAILPLGPPAGRAPVLNAEALTQRLLLDWGNDPDRLEVLGPTVTAGRGLGERPLGNLLEELGVAYALHARYLPEGEGLLLELIRTDDGAHVWVERYLPGAETDGVSEDVGRAMERWLVGG